MVSRITKSDSAEPIFLRPTFSANSSLHSRPPDRSHHCKTIESSWSFSSLKFSFGVSVTKTSFASERRLMLDIAFRPQPSVEATTLHELQVGGAGQPSLVDGIIVSEKFLCWRGNTDFRLFVGYRSNRPGFLRKGPVSTASRRCGRPHAKTLDYLNWHQLLFSSGIPTA